MAITGNKGEWSEIYVLLRLLGDGTLFAGDKNLSKIEKLYYPIKQIKRTEDTTEIIFSVLPDKIITVSNTSESQSLPAHLFTQEADKLLQTIKNSVGSSFTSSDTERFINGVYCHKLKARSVDKTDIKIVIHDMRTCADPELGFSIKSYLGNNPTLLNAGRTTNFIFKLSKALPDEVIKEINSIDTRSKVRDRVAAIAKNGATLIFDKLESEIFENNLILIDGDLPNIIGNMLLIHFCNDNLYTIEDLAQTLQSTNPLKYNTAHNHKFYEYKIKKFLTDCALGLMPAKVWNGREEANGGYIVVKQDGDIVCYHIYNRNEFEDYLFAKTRLETASTTRYEFGEISESENGEQIFKLNLQIRFLY